MNLPAIKKLLNTPEGLELKELLAHEVKKLDSIASVTPLDDPVALAVETKAQKKAYDTLMHILGDLLDIQEVPIVKEKGHELVPE